MSKERTKKGGKVNSVSGVKLQDISEEKHQTQGSKDIWFQDESAEEVNTEVRQNETTLQCELGALLSV